MNTLCGAGKQRALSQPIPGALTCRRYSLDRWVQTAVPSTGHRRQADVRHLARHHDNLAFAHIDRAITEFHSEASLEYEKQFISIRVRMPVVGAQERGNFDVLSIQAGDDPRRPVVVDAREFVVEVNTVHPLSNTHLGADEVGGAITEVFVWLRNPPTLKSMTPLLHYRLCFDLFHLMSSYIKPANDPTAAMRDRSVKPFH